MKVSIVGLGLVGLRVARELAGTDSVESVLIQSGDKKRQSMVKDALGSKVVLDPKATQRADVVILATPDEYHVELARAALSQGTSVVSVAEAPSTVLELLALEKEAVQKDATVVVGAGFSPGLSMVLGKHAGDYFDRVDEVHVAVTGIGGPACARRKATAAFEHGTEWRDGSWQEVSARSGREIQWFADPLGAQECHKGALSEPLLLQRMFPRASRLTARMSASPGAEWRAVLGGLFRSKPEADAIGAIRIEVRGLVGQTSDTLVYGAVDRPSVATSVVATSAAVLCGLSPEDPRKPPSGAIGVAEIAKPTEFLAEFSRRGVKAGVFEGTRSTAAPQNP